MRAKAKKPVERGKLEKKALANSRKEWISRKGSVLTAAIMMTLVGSLVAGSLATQVSQQSSYSYHGELSQKALFVAEAGANEAIALLKENYNYKDDPSNFPETAFGNGTYDVTIQETGNIVAIISTGTIDGVERTVSINVTEDTGAEGLDFAFFSNDNMTIQGNPDVIGDIHSNEDITISGNPIIDGNASATGNIVITGNPSVNGTFPGVPPVDFPSFDFNYYYNLADPSDRYSGNQNWSGNQTLTPVNGVIYIDGDIRISGNITLVGAIVATGSITINGNVSQTGIEGVPMLMSRDNNIRINGNVTQGDGMIYAKTGDILIYGNVTMDGQVVAFGQLYVAGNPDVTGTGEVAGGFEGEVGEGFKVLTYHE